MSFCGRRTYINANGKCFNIIGMKVNEIKSLVEASSSISSSEDIVEASSSINKDINIGGDIGSVNTVGPYGANCKCKTTSCRAKRKEVDIANAQTMRNYVVNKKNECPYGWKKLGTSGIKKYFCYETAYGAGKYNNWKHRCVLPNYPNRGANDEAYYYGKLYSPCGLACPEGWLKIWRRQDGVLSNTCYKAGYGSGRHSRNPNYRCYLRASYRPKNYSHCFQYNRAYLDNDEYYDDRYSYQFVSEWKTVPDDLRTCPDAHTAWI